MKKLLNFIPLAILFSACDGEESENVMSQLPPEPGVDVYVVKYKDASYSDYVHVIYSGADMCRICYETGTAGPSPFYPLQDGFYMSNVGLYIRNNIAIVGIKYSDYTGSASHYFKKDEILQKEIFSALYIIPSHSFPTFVDMLTEANSPISIHYPENVEFIRSMIDDGRIERYRVDLGY